MKDTVEKVIISLALLLLLYIILFYVVFRVFVPMDEPVINFIAECMIWFPIGILMVCMEIIRVPISYTGPNPSGTSSGSPTEMVQQMSSFGREFKSTSGL